MFVDGSVQGVVVLVVALAAGVLSYFWHLAVAEHCISAGTCSRIGDTCSFVNNVGIAGDAIFGSDKNDSLALFTRGVCAPGERLQLDTKKRRRCRPHYPYPDALNGEIMDLGATTEHMHACGEWIDADDSTMRTKTEYRAFYHSDEAADAIRALERDRIASTYTTSTDMDKLYAACTRTVVGGPAALRAAAVKAYQHLLTDIGDATTRDEALKNVGKLASYHCPAPVLIGIGIGSGGLLATATRGYTFGRNDLAKMLFAVEEDVDIQRHAELGNDLVNTDDPTSGAVALADYDLIFEGASGEADSDHVTLRDETIPELNGLVNALSDDDNLPYINAYIRGVAATCALTLGELTAVGRTDGNKHRTTSVIDKLRKQRPAIVELDRLRRDPDAHKLPRFGTDELRMATTTTFSQLEKTRSSDAREVCSELVEILFQDQLDELRFSTLVDDNLYARLDTLTTAIRAAVVDTVTNYAPISSLFTNPSSVANAVTTAKVRIAGAPRGTWAGMKDTLERAPGLSSDDGVLVMALKQSKTLFDQRINGLVYDSEDACDAPPVMDSLEANAYVFPTLKCIYVLLGLLRRPFADTRYDDTSLAVKIGYIIAHEFSHIESISVNDQAAEEALLHRYPYRSTHTEALADVIAAISLVRGGFASGSDVCFAISQNWCARTPVNEPSETSHPGPNVRGDRLCDTLADLGIFH